jgi:hypothetical protein
MSGSIGLVPTTAATNSVGVYLTESYTTELTYDKNDETSFLITGSLGAKMYFSGSGKMGIGTTDPQDELDLRADSFQLQRRSERKGMRLNSEGNVESFDKTSTSAATGSELILNYSRGVTVTTTLMQGITGEDFESDEDAVAAFNDKSVDEQTKILNIAEQEGFLAPAQTGDVLGSIRWVAQSGSVGDLDERTTGEAATITAIVSDGDSTGVQADLSFKVAGKTGAASQKLLLDANNQHQMTGSLALSGYLDIGSVPTSDPGIAGRIWRSGTDLKISLG